MSEREARSGEGLTVGATMAVVMEAAKDRVEAMVGVEVEGWGGEYVKCDVRRRSLNRCPQSYPLPGCSTTMTFRFASLAGTACAGASGQPSVCVSGWASIAAEHVGHALAEG
jgi:hypothetical protein